MATPGISNHTHNFWSTCALCRKRYGFRAAKKRYERQIASGKSRSAAYATIRLKDLMREAIADPDLIEEVPLEYINDWLLDTADGAAGDAAHRDADV